MNCASRCSSSLCFLSGSRAKYASESHPVDYGCGGLAQPYASTTRPRVPHPSRLFAKGGWL